jgi:hypothetical protein
MIAVLDKVLPVGLLKTFENREFTLAGTAAAVAASTLMLGFTHRTTLILPV